MVLLVNNSSVNYDEHLQNEGYYSVLPRFFRNGLNFQNDLLKYLLSLSGFDESKDLL